MNYVNIMTRDTIEKARDLTPGQALRIARTKVGMTQEKLAEEIDLTHAQIGKIERNERNLTLSNAKVLAKILNISPIQLMFPNEFNELTQEYFEVVTSLPDAEKQRAIALLRALASSTPGQA